MNFPSSGSRQKFRIHADPDPQHWWYQRQKTGDRTGDRRRETGQGRQDRGDRTVVQETVDFVLRWDWETGDRRQEKGDRR